MVSPLIALSDPTIQDGFPNVSDLCPNQSRGFPRVSACSDFPIVSAFRANQPELVLLDPTSQDDFPTFSALGPNHAVKMVS